MIKDEYLTDMVAHLVVGTPGTFVYVGSNLDQAIQAKAMFVEMKKDKRAAHIPRSSRKYEYVTDAQRFLFTSTRSVLLGCALRGIRATIIYLDVSPEDRVELRNEILPAVACCGGKLL